MYIYAAILYPGGSQFDPSATHFDLLHNYWCNLMGEYTINDVPNTAYPIAITANTVICIGTWFFFMQCSYHLPISKLWCVVIRVSGSLTMLLTVFVFTSMHDIITILASMVGLFTLVGIMWGVVKSELTQYKILGLICLILIALNNFIYYTEYQLNTLPFIQKITFALVLFWVMRLNILFSKKVKY